LWTHRPACAWIFEKLWTWSDHPGDFFEVLSRERILDNITLNWVTRTGASSARLYWESIDESSTWFIDSVGDRIDVPTGCSVFPREDPRPSRRLAEPRFNNIVHRGEPLAAATLVPGSSPTHSSKKSVLYAEH
jgi:hypothetical protein